jgi:uncharacterized membrane protein
MNNSVNEQSMKKKKGENVWQQFSILKPEKQISFLFALINLLLIGIPLFPLFQDLAFDDLITTVDLLITKTIFILFVGLIGLFLVISCSIKKNKSFRDLGIILFTIGISTAIILVINYSLNLDYWYELSLVFLIFVALSIVGIFYSLLTLLKEKNFYGYFGLIFNSLCFIYQLFHLMYLNINRPPLL